MRQPVLNALLRTSPDTASAITMVVTAISSNDLLISCHALAEIDTVLRGTVLITFTFFPQLYYQCKIIL